MDPNLFNVIYTGRLLDGFETEDVIKAFASKFKVPETKANQIINANKDVVLKPRAEHVKAYKFKSALEAIGMEVRLQRAAMLAAAKPKVEKKPEPLAEAAPTVKTESSKKPEIKNTQTLGNASWSLEPIEKEQEEAVTESPASTSPAYQPRETETVSQPQSTAYQTKTDSGQTTSGRTLGDLFKTIGGLVVGGLGVLFIAVKKFGLFKILKIGGLMTAAAFAGYDPEEICMGNGMCEDAIDDQIDDCWEQSGMDKYDWDNMSVEQYLSLKPKVENEFVACFIYQDTGQRVLESPLEIRFDLIDNCYENSNNDCIELAESQLKSCYTANDIDALISAQTMDFYGALAEHPRSFKNYYSCFLDGSGQPLFADIVRDWDDIYYGDY
ncbi:MAG: hypothetical protein R3E90_07115 [Marinicella sp.]|nr:hypothetical protein [Xanthomonadales bacterium]